MLMWSESIDTLQFYSTPLLPRAELMFYLYQKRLQTNTGRYLWKQITR